jgi:hypothetical protein
MSVWAVEEIAVAITAMLALVAVYWLAGAKRRSDVDHSGLSAEAFTRWHTANIKFLVALLITLVGAVLVQLRVLGTGAAQDAMGLLGVIVLSVPLFFLPLTFAVVYGIKSLLRKKELDCR